jgi:hypothetical protein
LSDNFSGFGFAKELIKKIYTALNNNKMNTKKDIKQMPEYFDRYINLCDDDTDVIDALKISLQELQTMPIDKWLALGDNTYAAGKWTAKDLLQHILDTEKVFMYRIISIARGEKKEMTPYEEDDYAKNAQANRRTIADLVEELMLSRKLMIKMYESFTTEMLHQLGNGYGGVQYCPLALGFTMAGHQCWHFKVMEERYFPIIPLLNK